MLKSNLWHHVLITYVIIGEIAYYILLSTTSTVYERYLIERVFFIHPSGCRITFLVRQRSLSRFDTSLMANYTVKHGLATRGVAIGAPLKIPISSAVTSCDTLRCPLHTLANPFARDDSANEGRISRCFRNRSLVRS